MPETKGQDRTLYELVVKEAVEKGMDTPLRDSILEGVEESGGGGPAGGRGLPLAGALFGLGAAVGFLAGRQSTELEETPLEDVQEPEIIEDVVEDVAGESGEADVSAADGESEAEGSPSRLPRIIITLGVIAGAVLLRRRLGGGEEEEWEPIEEFEPATSAGVDEEEEAAEADEGEETADEEDEEEE
ncbi:hypothetical protein ACFO5R_09620 [Halosolutus amylolyticus]|uniref:MYXO-CTERM domain-containing protein n=1 Tax=Halosolutus amylolyticus TaxID=2932267 RepID=A0ABD5PP10_9EURY|nr:hypothetical protein [Halosolutus amylolyticus]